MSYPNPTNHDLWEAIQDLEEKVEKLESDRDLAFETIHNLIKLVWVPTMKKTTESNTDTTV